MHRQFSLNQSTYYISIHQAGQESATNHSDARRIDGDSEKPRLSDKTHAFLVKEEEGDGMENVDQQKLVCEEEVRIMMT